MEVKKVEDLCDKLPIVRYAEEVIKALIRRKYKVGIISSNFSPVVKSYATRLGVHFFESATLEEKDGLYTGKINKISNNWLKDTFSEGFVTAFQSSLKHQGVKKNETVMVAGNEKSISAFKMAGLSVAFRPKSSLLKESADKTIHVLAELLAIIE